MDRRSYIWTSRFLTFVFIVAFGLGLNYIDPETSGLRGKLIFYALLFLALTSFFNLFLLFIRRGMMDRETSGLNAELSLRQSILLAILVLGLLILQSFKMLVWWDGLLLVAGIFLAELYFLSGE